MGCSNSPGTGRGRAGLSLPDGRTLSPRKTNDPQGLLLPAPSPGNPGVFSWCSKGKGGNFMPPARCTPRLWFSPLLLQRLRSAPLSSQTVSSSKCITGLSAPCGVNTSSLFKPTLKGRIQGCKSSKRLTQAYGTGRGTCERSLTARGGCREPPTP